MGERTTLEGMTVACGPPEDHDPLGVLIANSYRNLEAECDRYKAALETIAWTSGGWEGATARRALGDTDGTEADDA